MYHARASKLDHWLGQKAAWVQASNDHVLAALGKEPAPVTELGLDKLQANEAVAPVEEQQFLPMSRSPMSPVKANLPSPAPPPTAPETLVQTAPPPLTRFDSVAGALPESANAEPLAPRSKSLLDSLFDALKENFGIKSPGEADPAAVATAAPQSPSVRSAAVLRTRKAYDVFSAAMAQRKMRFAREASLDSISAAMARLNLLKAYEEEQASRDESRRALGALYDELTTMGSLPQDLLSKRKEQIDSSFAALVEAAGAYRAELEEVLAQQTKIEEGRLAFAKRAEMLNRWLEETTDAISEVMQIETVREADGIDEALKTFRVEERTRRAECEALAALEATLASSGPNPYTRFVAADLRSALDGAVAAADERTSRLALERVKISEADQQKRRFAECASTALTFLAAEKAKLEASTPTLLISSDDADSIAAGHARKTQLEEYATRAAERAEQLAPAQELADALFAMAEMDNPYTRQSMASLKSAFEQLEQLVRDKLSLVCGQLARATMDITPEQMAELEKAFSHFDRDRLGKLNKFQFGAAIKALDHENDLDEEFDKFADGTGRNPDTGATEGTISFDAFIRLMQKIYKVDDTPDALNGAFRTLSNGKDVLPAEELDKYFKDPAHAAFLRESLAEVEGSFDYSTFYRKVYNK